MLIRWDTEIVDVIEHSEASIRLYNVIQRLATANEMPVKTIGEYFQIGEIANELFHNIRGMGRKTCIELDTVLNTYRSALDSIQFDTHQSADACALISIDSLFESLERLNMKDIILRHDLSARTQNFYKHQDFHKMAPNVVTLGGYLQDKKRAHQLMKQFPNVGQKTCNEVHSFIGKWLEQKLLAAFDNQNARLLFQVLFDRALLPIEPAMLSDFHTKIEQFDFLQATTPVHVGEEDEDEYNWDEILLSNMPTSEKTLKIIAAILEERDFEILVLRYGLGGKKFTLQTLGDRYGVTRERVRQIETRALKKLRIPSHLNLLEILLQERQEDLTNTLFRSNSVLSIKALRFVKKDVLPNDLFLIEVTHDTLKKWLSAKFIAHGNDKKIISWSKEDALNTEHLQVQSGDVPIHVGLLDAIMSLPWPTSLKQLYAQFPGYPPSLINEILNERYNVQTEGGHISSIRNLPMRHRLVIVLKSVGHELHTSEVVAHHSKMFGIPTNEHAVGAVLMRLDEALITARGVYNLYENLTFTKEHLLEIRDAVYYELQQSDSFISSKKLFEKLFAFKLDAYPEKLSDYMLHGIIQDDIRFDVRRGLMVGLKTSNYDGKFKSLQEEIWTIIDTKGPISIPDIREELSSTRKVLDSTIEVSISSMSDVFANETKTYDKVERIFGSENAYKMLVRSIYVNLLKGPLSLFALQTKLSKVSQQINERTLRSVLQSLPSVSYTGKITTLLNIPEDIKEYATFITTNSLDNLPDNLLAFRNIDAEAISNESPDVENTGGVFNSILSEFEF